VETGQKNKIKLLRINRYLFVYISGSRLLGEIHIQSYID